MIISRDVVFDENKVGYKYLACSDPTDNTLHIPISDLQLNSICAEPEILLMPDVDSEHIDDDPQSSIETNPTSDLSLTPKLRDPADPSSLTPSHQIPSPSSLQRPAPIDRTIGPAVRRYPSRNRKPSVKLRDFWTLVSELLEEPLDFHTANQQMDWRRAIDSEINSIMKNQTWEVVDRPQGRTPITGKWIFKIKRNMQGGINKLKARIVVRGFQQKEGLDYNDIFAPVVRWSTILIIFALAAQNH